MKIEKYKFLGNGKYEIFLDKNKYILYEDIILKHNILSKQEINVEDVKTYLNDNKYYEAYYKAIKYINIKLRANKEIKEYLKRNEYNNTIIEKVLKKLKNDGYINEELYTECFINDQINLKNVGPLKIEKELEKLEISKETINKYIKNYSKKTQLEKINKLIDKEIKLNNNKSSYILKNKILINLINKGFYKEDIINILEQIEIDDTLIKEKEYNKTYTSLSKKYSGKELEYKVKQKMYQKGFKV